jgi:hypothetical protein
VQWTTKVAGHHCQVDFFYFLFFFFLFRKPHIYTSRLFSSHFISS